MAYSGARPAPIPEHNSPAKSVDLIFNIGYTSVMNTVKDTVMNPTVTHTINLIRAAVKADPNYLARPAYTDAITALALVHGVPATTIDQLVKEPQ